MIESLSDPTASPIPLLLPISLVVPVGIAVLALVAWSRGDARWKTRSLVALCVLLGIGLLWLSGFIREVAAVHPFEIGSAGLGVVAVAWLILSLFIIGRSRGRKRCRKCEYDMSATTDLRCPECGWKASNEQGLYATRRHWRLAGLAIVPLLIGAYVGVQPIVREGGWQAMMPTTVVIWVLEFGDRDWALGVLEERVEKPDFYADGFVMSGVWDNASFSSSQWRHIGSACIDEFADKSLTTKQRMYLHRWLQHAHVASAGSETANKISAIFTAHLDDEDPYIRSVCMESLVDPERGIESIAIIKPFLLDEHQGARTVAYHSLRHFVPESAEATELLLDGLRHDDPLTRKIVLMTISSASKDATMPVHVIERVRAMADDPGPHVRTQHVQTLAQVLSDDEALHTISVASVSDDPRHREGALWAAHSRTEKMTCNPCLQILVKALTDEDAENRDIATFLIEDIGFERFAEYRTVFEQSHDPNRWPDTDLFIKKALQSFEEGN